MESYGTVIFIGLLIIGLALLLFKKEKENRILGVLAILVSCFILYFIPHQSHAKFEKKSIGTYYNDNYDVLIVYDNSSFALYDYKHVKLDSGRVEYEHVDLDKIYLNGKKYFMEGGTQLEICCGPNGSFRKRY